MSCDFKIALSIIGSIIVVLAAFVTIVTIY